MKITDLLAKESIRLGSAVKDKQDVLNQMVDLMDRSGKLSDRKQYLEAVEAREAEGTTGVGVGIAIPHGRCSGVREAGLAAMTIDGGVDYDALDGNPVDLVFLIAAPENSGNVHLEILSKLATMLMDETFVTKLRNAGTPEEFLSVIDNAEAEKDESNAKKSAEPVTNVLKGDHLVLAVTACPTGIAHTYMAAEAIEKAAKAKGIQIKVETRGSGGAKNVLTPEEIDAADGIIVAADTNVPMDRFDGKKVVECQVSKGINKPDELIEEIIAGQAPVFKAANVKKEAVKDNGGHQIYKHLMSGVSHMLPFVVGGGILIALAFLVDGLAFDINSLSAEQRANFGSLTALSSLLKGQIGGLAFGFMLPVLAGFIAMSIADRPGLAVGFVGGAIAANGKSGFLGALAAGFLAGYIVNLLKKLSDKYVPDSLDGIKPVLIYPLLGMLAIGLIMVFAIEPVVGALNTWLNNALGSLSGANVVLLGAIVAGMMAIDMGGPFNKAAYVFATGMLASQTDAAYMIMAAVMIGG
ncbi:MAG: PTS sugar transporter subunit IIA, partial [Erysipelotrichaceae bacterium]|nr:PTS sugar transporter subunit IIA [Erysipelotrichaceae bacterium]